MEPVYISQICPKEKKDPNFKGPSELSILWDKGFEDAKVQVFRIINKTGPVAVAMDFLTGDHNFTTAMIFAGAIESLDRATEPDWVYESGGWGWAITKEPKYEIIPEETWSKGSEAYK